VRNDGEATWRPEDRVRVGTSSPRDSTSRFEDPAWLAPNRAATFSAAMVPPGAIGCFEFPVRVPRGVVTQEFEIVADGICWLPGTTFAVTVRGRRRPLFRRFFQLLQRRHGPLARACRRVTPPAVRAWLAGFAADRES
jgi:hypothetical protein